MSTRQIETLINDLAADNNLSLRQLAFRSGMTAQSLNSITHRESVSTRSLSRLFDTVGEELIIIRNNKKYILNGKEEQ